MTLEKRGVIAPGITPPEEREDDSKAADAKQAAAPPDRDAWTSPQQRLAEAAQAALQKKA